MSDFQFTSDHVAEAANAAYEGTKRYYEYANEHVIPILVSVMAPSQYEHSLLGVYYRLHLLMRSVAKLDSYDDFQVVRATARSMFELMLDIRTLKMTPSLAARFFSFPMIERMRTAIQVADFVALHARPEMRDRYKNQIQHAKDVTAIANCEAALLADFDIHTSIAIDRVRKFPKSWVKKSVRNQAAAIGVETEASYLADYSIASWFVHGGFAGMESISRDGFVAVYLRGHRLAVKSYHEATFVVSQELKLFDAQSHLWTHMKYLENLSTQRFYDYMKGQDLD